MMEAEIGVGRQFADSKTMLNHVRKAANRIRTMIDSSSCSLFNV